MQYRKFGRLDYQVSALGFGCMRLPCEADGTIREEEARAMVRWAIDHGVNYIDVGYPYHGGRSEPFVGRTLRDGYRERVHLATKMRIDRIQVREDFDRLLGEQLERLQTDHLDVYLLHGLRRWRWPKVRDLGVCDWADRQLADGRIGAIGFSFHDSFDMLKEIIDAYPNWSVCQVQHNYLNERFQASTRGLRYAAYKGLAVVIMEPLLGGRLAQAPAEIAALWARAETQRSPAEWALQWLWDQPEVSVVLSGMSAMEQVQENVASAGRSGVARLTGAEIGLVEAVRDAYRQRMAVSCTGCGYCMPCPEGVDIPRTFTALNNGVLFGNLDGARRGYAGLMEDEPRTVLASHCVQCGLCEPRCPRSLPIGQWMAYIHEVLAEGRAYRKEEEPGDPNPW